MFTKQQNVQGSLRDVCMLHEMQYLCGHLPGVVRPSLSWCSRQEADQPAAELLVSVPLTLRADDEARISPLWKLFVYTRRVFNDQLLHVGCVRLCQELT